MSQPPEDNAVARNRAADPRRAEGRTPLGAAHVRRGVAVTVAVLLVATSLLVAVLVMR